MATADKEIKKMESTITKQITDMSKYGITGDNQWDGSVIVKQPNGGISVHGQYFPTKEEAEEYADKLIAELEAI